MHVALLAVDTPPPAPGGAAEQLLGDQAGARALRPAAQRAEPATLRSGARQCHPQGRAPTPVADEGTGRGDRVAQGPHV